jgi:hypothetical protein
VRRGYPKTGTKRLLDGVRQVIPVINLMARATTGFGMLEMMRRFHRTLSAGWARRAAVGR